MTSIRESITQFKQLGAKVALLYRQHLEASDPEESMLKFEALGDAINELESLVLERY